MGFVNPTILRQAPALAVLFSPSDHQPSLAAPTARAVSFSGRGRSASEQMPIVSKRRMARLQGPPREGPESATTDNAPESFQSKNPRGKLVPKTATPPPPHAHR